MNEGNLVILAVIFVGKFQHLQAFINFPFLLKDDS